MNKLLMSNIKEHAGRYVATMVAIVLSTTFLMACMVVAGGFQNVTRRLLASEIEGAQAVIHSDSFDGENDLIALDSFEKKVRSVHPDLHIESYKSVFGFLEIENFSSSPITIRPVGDVLFQPKHFIEGSFPQDNNQLALSSEDAKSKKIKIGDKVTLINGNGAEEEKAEKKSFTVCGIVDSPMGMFATVFVAEPAISSWMKPYENSGMLLFASDNNLDDEQIKSNLLSVAKNQKNLDSFKISTASEYTNSKVSENSGDVMMFILALIFPFLAMVTTIIVISTTFNVLFTQRRRELALLRLVGATSRQVTRLVVHETLLVGIVSSVVGIVLGWVIGAGISKFFGLAWDYAEAFSVIDWWMPLVTLLCGIAMTLLAGYKPAHSVGRVSPMAALDVNESTQVVIKRRVGRSIFGSVLMILGLTGLWFGTRMVAQATTIDNFDSDKAGNGFLVSLGSGFITFIALLILCTVILPVLTSFVGKLLAGNRVDWQLAAENTRRNPARTGATATALILGITLVSTMLVGTESSKMTVKDSIDKRAPVDIELTAGGLDFSDSSIESLGKLEGVKALKVFDTIKTKSRSDDPESFDTFVSKWVDFSSVMNGSMPSIKPGQILSNRPQKFVYLENDKDWQKYEVVNTRLPQNFVTAEDFDRLIRVNHISEQDIMRNVVWIKLDSNISMSDILKTVQNIEEIIPGVEVDGTAPMRVMIYRVIDAINWSAIGMLAVSVIVALVGVGNTLALSVLERRRENAMLRALGMRKGRIASMLTVEALLVGLLSAFVGIGAGIFFGWVGMNSLPFGESNVIVISIPWLSLGAVGLVAVLAAIVASVLPARKAAKIPPVQSLACAQ